MSCLLNESNINKELEFISNNKAVRLIQLTDNNAKFFLDFKTDDTNTIYLKLAFNKNLKNDNPFTIEIIENNLNESIEIQNFIESFLQKFFWEKDMVHLNDFFEKYDFFFNLDLKRSLL